MTPEQELEQVNAAIAAVLKGGQSFTLSTGGGSRTTTFAGYEALVKRKKELETLIAAQSGTLGGRLGAAW